MPGDADIAAVGALLAEPSRARILMALADGRALPASVLAAEAAIAASTASAHLGRLVDGGLLAVEAHGRHRYYRFAGPQVAELVESVARIAPPAPVRSLRQGTRAEAVRRARTCYDHLAGRLGTELMAALLRDGVLAGGDGAFHPELGDHLSQPGRDVPYELADPGPLLALGVDPAAIGGRRPLIRYCIDWSEQRHHLAGALGAALAERLFALGWVRRLPRSRAVRITAAGTDGLRDALGLAWS
jgi:DNA-binding transcriptional ArsR family regulator